MRHILGTWLLATIFGLTLAMPAWADQSSKQNQSDNNDTSAAASQNSENNGADHQGQAWLGVAVEAIHPSFLNHLEAIIGGAYGLMVDDVAEGSPADKAGLEEGDILVRFDDQKLYSPEQLLGLLRGDQPGQQETLTILRNGKTQNLKVTLGHQPRRGQAFSHAAGGQNGPGWAGGRQNMRTSARNDDENENENDWNTFDAMMLTQTGKNQFKAQIRYRNDDGELETRSFQGTRDELQKDITSQKDLPKSERDHLLNALNLTEVFAPLEQGSRSQQGNSGNKSSDKNSSDSDDSNN